MLRVLVLAQFPRRAHGHDCHRSSIRTQWRADERSVHGPLLASPRSVSVIFTVIFVDGMFGVVRARSLRSNNDADWSL
jgi:hypothetical protein